MNIYTDESGTFVSANYRGAWNVVAAYIAPESTRRSLDAAVSVLKAGYPRAMEVKLNDISEDRLIAFLQKLGSLSGILFCTATDAGLNSAEIVAYHRSRQVEEVRRGIPRMRFEGGRQALILLSEQLEGISIQLYVQLVCQVNLIHEILSRSIVYYAQRVPGTLGAFRWRIDQKNSKRTDFEDAFEKIAPALLQTRSLREPVPFVTSFDYSRFQKYRFSDETFPDYLQSEYGIEVPNKDGFDLQKVLRDDIRFLDSKESEGIQIADILSSAMRRCLRGDFVRNDEISGLLAKLMVQKQHSSPPIDFISFSNETVADSVAARVGLIARLRCRPILKR